MHTRTTNPISDHFDAYGARGIGSDEFENFTDFYDTMYDSFIEHVEKYGIENTTLERIDVNKDYCKENCTWATWEEQFDNKQNTVYFKVIYPDKSEKIFRNIKKYETDLGVPHNTIYYRLNGKIKSNTYNGCKYILLGTYSDLSEEDKNALQSA